MDWRQHLHLAERWIEGLAWRLAGAAAILVAGLLLASFLSSCAWYVARRGDRGYDLDRRRRSSFVALVIRVAIWVATASLMFSALGVPASVISVIVTVGVGLGVFADSLSGLRALLFPPFHIADVIELKSEGVTGMVSEISLSGVVLQVPSGGEVMVPSRKLFDSLLVNHTAAENRKMVSFRVRLPVKDMEASQALTQGLLDGLPGVLPQRAPTVHFAGLCASTVTLDVRFFVQWHARREVASEFVRCLMAELTARQIPVEEISETASEAT